MTIDAQPSSQFPNQPKSDKRIILHFCFRGIHILSRSMNILKCIGEWALVVHGCVGAPDGANNDDNVVDDDEWWVLNAEWLMINDDDDNDDDDDDGNDNNDEVYQLISC